MAYSSPEAMDGLNDPVLFGPQSAEANVRHPVAVPTGISQETDCAGLFSRKF